MQLADLPINAATTQQARGYDTSITGLGLDQIQPGASYVL
jgi:hypothetical protein